MWKILVKYSNNTNRYYYHLCYNEALEYIQWEIDKCGDLVLSIELVRE